MHATSTQPGLNHHHHHHHHHHHQRMPFKLLRLENMPVPEKQQLCVQGKEANAQEPMSYVRS
eukprot:162008-Chlamydomonas_euryale.AAC.1